MSAELIYDIVIHLSYLLFLVGFSLKDILWLRIVIIVAATVDLIGRMWLSPEPMYADVVWCIFDILVNAYQLTIIVKERSTLTFNPKEELLHKLVFTAIPSLHFKRLMNLAIWKTIPKGSRLIQQNTEVETLMVLFDGTAQVEIDGNIVTYLGVGKFIGEMSFLSGNLTSANVDTLSECTVVEWNKAQLRELMQKDEVLERSMHSVFSADLVQKLIKNNKGE